MSIMRPEPAGRLTPIKDQLDARYGAIGISAVAAAVRYQGENKNAGQDLTASQNAKPKRAPDLAA